jgi:integrase
MNTTSRRGHGDGGIDQRGENIWRLRYRIPGSSPGTGKRFTATFKGSLSDARKELRRLIRSGDVGEHVDPSRITVKEWVGRWLELLARQPNDGGESKRRRGLISARSQQRYDELLRNHIIPTLGQRSLQQLQAADLDALYVRLEQGLSPNTVRFAHAVLSSCLRSAVKKGLVLHNVAEKAEAPAPIESEVGQALEAGQLRTLLDGFRGRVLYPIVATAIFTGARRSEILGLRWTDLDLKARTLRIERSVEFTRKYGLNLKEPKRAKHKRTIQVDDTLIEILLGEKKKHLQIAAGVPDGATVDLGLVKLPDDALMFPNPPGPGESFDFARLRHPDLTTKEFTRRAAALGFMIRFHDLRCSHETLLLDSGTPIHVVAARCGHDPAVLLRVYAKRTRRADTSAAAVITAIAKEILGSRG